MEEREAEAAAEAAAAAEESAAHESEHDPNITQTANAALMMRIWQRIREFFHPELRRQREAEEQRRERARAAAKERDKRARRAERDRQRAAEKRKMQERRQAERLRAAFAQAAALPEVVPVQSSRFIAAAAPVPDQPSQGTASKFMQPPEDEPPPPPPPVRPRRLRSTFRSRHFAKLKR